MPIQIDVSVSAPGGVSEDDELGADLVIDTWNAGLETDENGDPINPLPNADNAERAASLQTIMQARAEQWFVSYVRQAKDLLYNDRDRQQAYRDASQSVRNQIDTLLGL